MNRRAVAAMLLVSGGAASALAIMTGDRGAVSLQIWVACFVVVFSVSTVNQLRARAPLARNERRSILKPKATDTPDTRSSVGRQRSLEGLVLRSRDHDRAFTQRLQPQLIVLAAHHLRVSHGIDLEHDRAGAGAVLGDVAWLLDTTNSKRTPTLEELDRFIRLLQPSSHAGVST